MSKKKKSERDPTAIYGVGGCEGATPQRIKYQNLVRDFHHLQKVADLTRSRLDARKQRKLALAAEVCFLRRRFKYFVKAQTLNSAQKEKSTQPPNPSTRTKHVAQLGRKEAGQNKLPVIPESKPKRKRYIGKESDFYSCAPPIEQHHNKLLHGGKDAVQQSLIPFACLEHNGRMDISKKKNVTLNITPVFDLNQDTTHSGKEVSFPSRALTFDLNEISTGDEDFQSDFEALKYEEVKKRLMRGPMAEMQNDLMLPLCRNTTGEGPMQNDLMLPLCRNTTGEGPSRVGKRKISWQDSVALRV